MRTSCLLKVRIPTGTVTVRRALSELLRTKRAEPWWL
jgi:hypothetical protein